MEPSKEPITVRASQLNSLLLSNKVQNKSNIISRDGLLDALTVLYDECNNDCLKGTDVRIADFISRKKSVLSEMKCLRVNASDFELKSVIGRGQFGEVFMVQERQTSDLYAMKIIKKSDCLQQKSISYEEERNIMASTDSAWMSKLQYAFQDTNNLYLIMEYFSGGDLSNLLRRQGGTIPESAASFYIAELVLALNDLHQMGYVHRDVKLENVLLDRCGHIKLADFGSAAKINSFGYVTEGMHAGTSEYIAPEVLLSMDNKMKSGYGMSCDYWSVGILGYLLTIGNTPFVENSTTNTYSKIMNSMAHLKFPPDTVLSQAFISLIKGLLSESNSRLNYEQVVKHPLFKNIDFNSIMDQVPPYVPKIESIEDTSNFSSMPNKRNEPNIENYKSKTQFSGRNLPFIGFTYTCDANKISNLNVDYSKKVTIQVLKKEIRSLQKQMMKSQNSLLQVDNIEKELIEKSRKLDNLENLRDHLEKDLANSIAESSTLKRTLELERKDRIALEQKALELIKSAKQKWENSEKSKIEGLNLEIIQQKEKIQQLSSTNALLNEQLQHALQIQHKHRDSVETLEHLSRKSIIGLETRLEMVTLESQNRITELQNKLTNEIHQKNLLQNDLTVSRNNEILLNEKFKGNEENCNGLLIKLEGNQKLIRQLENKIEILEKSLKNADEHKKKVCVLEDQLVKLRNDQIVAELEQKLRLEVDLNLGFSTQIKELKEELNATIISRNTFFEEQKRNYSIHLQEVQEQLSKTLEKASQLEFKLQEAKTIEVNNKLKVQTLEELLQRLELGINKLETDGGKENVLKQQIERLELQLIQVHEVLALEKQELSQLKTKFWRTEKDLSNAEIDKRIFKRELKDIEEGNKRLKEEIEILTAKMAEKAHIQESALLELENLNDDLAQEIIKLKDLISHLESKLEEEKEKYDKEQHHVSHLKMELMNKNNQLTVKTTEVEILRQQHNDLLTKIESFENDSKDYMIVKSELNHCQSELQNTQLNLKALQEACMLLEDQLIKYESIHALHENHLKSSNANTEKLIGELARSKEQIQEITNFMNKERSLKLNIEIECKRLVEDMKSLEVEVATYKQQCMDFREYSCKLTQELSSMEENITDYEVNIKSYERQITNLISENRMLKEENSNLLTSLNNTKDSNYKLGLELNEGNVNNNELIESLNELQNILIQKSDYHKERELKADSTIQQQIKLIDFLQSKIEDCKKKKKTLSDKLFGLSKKENVPPTLVAVNYKDLENMLLQERDINKSLQQEIVKLKSEFRGKSKNMLNKSDSTGLSFSPHTKIAVEKLTETPNTEKNELYRQNSKQRMYHNIPHRFETKLCTKTIKCVHCSNSVALGRNAKYCGECHIMVHPYCVSYVPKACGIPMAYVKHYSESLSVVVKGDEATVPLGNNDEEVINIEGWIKIPMQGNIGWHRHYACLTRSMLKIYREPPNNSNISPIETLELQSPNSHGMVILDPTMTEISTPIAISDLPFVIKFQISPNTTCWPPKSFVLMMLNIEDKERWSKVLTSIFETSVAKYKGDVLINIPVSLNLNCLIDLSDMKLLGTEQGLYSIQDKNLLHISGPLNVFQILILRKLNICIMIVDSNRYLISCNLYHLMSLTQCTPCSKPTLMFKSINVNNLQGFHLFETGIISGNTILSLATCKQLILMYYDQNLSEFIPTRILDTAEPTSCMLFTEHSLIVGTDKYFEIDLNTFEAEEFLDLSDKKLCQVLTCYEMGSFPIAIMKISQKPVEYLLCFNEFAVFVDEYGRHSRVSEMKWNRLPQAFYYHAPYLHIVQFASIEIIKIIQETCNKLKNSVDSLLNIDCCTLSIKNVRHLGSSRNGVYVASAEEILYLEGKRIYESEHDTGENASEEFSFTNSMIQSLDDHVSETDNGECNYDYHN
ncbi:hypothetical protein FQA39_LY18316 [Lamprigera yunnana]|nr:hypothetical protein FQA39_LY18316 [Lamprigera yunnana]